MTNSPLRNLNSIGSMYLTSFVIVLIFATLLLQIGSPIYYISILILVFVVSSYVFSGFVAGTMSLDTFQNADREGQAGSIAMALASGIIASGIFIVLAGEFFSQGTDALAIYWGWLLGIAFMTLLFAAQVARSKAKSAPEFISGNHEPAALRILALIAVLCSSTLLAIAQFVFVAEVGAQFLNVSEAGMIQAIALSVGICLIMSGMQGITLMRAIALPVMFLVFMAPLLWVAINIGGIPIPQFAYGTGALQPVAEINREIVAAGLATNEEIFSFTEESAGIDYFNYLATLLCIGCAVAAMPHLLQHFKLTDKGHVARRAGFFTFGLVLIFLSAVPAVAAFVQIDIYTSILGLQLSDLQSDASWVFGLSGAGTLPLIEVCNAFVRNAEEAINACGGNPDYFLSISDITINPGLLTLSQGILHQLPELVTIVLAGVAILAIMTTLDGLIFSIAFSLSNDGYQRFFRPQSPKSIQIFMCRFFIIFALAVISIGVIYFEPDGKLFFELAIAFTAATLFPALFIKIWLPFTSYRVQLTAFVTSTTLCCLALWAANFGIDMASNSGDEMVLRIPAITDRVSNYGIGMLGAMVSILVVSMAFLFKYLRIPTVTKETSNAAN